MALDNWYHEKESAWLYLQVAAVEPDPRKSQLFLRLAAAAEEQAASWMAASGQNAKRSFVPTLRARIVARLIRRFGPRSLRSVLAAMKLRGLSVYGAPVPHGATPGGQAPPTPTPPDVTGHVMPTSLSEVGARHRSGFGGNLRATVFGMNDGLLSNASLVLGVAFDTISSALRS
jgi:hypothetical protein